MALAGQALRLLGARLGHPRPIYVHYGVTHRCTQRCRMCVVWKSARPEAELAVPQVEQLAGELHRSGVRHVALGGGEPFVRPDLAGLVAAFTSRGISVRLLTNGVGIPVERIDAVVAAGLDHVSISLDSLDPAVERVIYSGRDVWDSIVASMRLFRARLPRRAQPIINVCVSRLNFAELPRLVSFAAGEGFACSFVPIALSPSEGASDGFAAHAPDLAVRKQDRGAVTAAYAELLRLKRSGAPIANSSRFLKDSVAFLTGGRSLWHCDAGELYFSVSPEGEISICHHFPPFARHDDHSLADRLAGAALRREARARRKDCPGCMRPCWAEVTHAVRDLHSGLEAARLLLRPPRVPADRKDS